MFNLFQSIAEAAEDIWDRYGHAFGTDYSGLFKVLSHCNYNVRLAAAEALAAALDENPDCIQVCLIIHLRSCFNNVVFLCFVDLFRSLFPLCFLCISVMLLLEMKILMLVGWADKE